MKAQPIQYPSPEWRSQKSLERVRHEITKCCEGLLKVAWLDVEDLSDDEVGIRSFWEIVLGEIGKNEMVCGQIVKVWDHRARLQAETEPEKLLARARPRIDAIAPQVSWIMSLFQENGIRPVTFGEDFFKGFLPGHEIKEMIEAPSPWREFFYKVFEMALYICKFRQTDLGRGKNIRSVNFTDGDWTDEETEEDDGDWTDDDEDDSSAPPEIFYDFSYEDMERLKAWRDSWESSHQGYKRREDDLKELTS